MMGSFGANAVVGVATAAHISAATLSKVSTAEQQPLSGSRRNV
jgi:hypothetical protein